jgi:hypothetical protein
MSTLKLSLFFICAFTICIGAVSQAGRWQKYSAPSSEIDTCFDNHEIKHSLPHFFVNHAETGTLFVPMTLLSHLESHFLLSTGVLAQLMQTNHLAIPPPFFV